ncbi:MAG: class III signal peptide-containing protein [Nanoarchaeota archaeon]
MLKKRGQVSVEYIMIVGIVLLLLIPIFYVSSEKISNEVKVSQANDAVTSLARAVNVVYSLGPGTKRFIEITIPGGVESTEVNGKLIQIRLHLFGGTSDVYATAITNVSGYVPSERGTYHLPLEAQEDGTVRIGGYNDTAPPTVIWKYPSGTIAVQDILLQATTNEPAQCRYDVTDTSYTSMSYYFSGNELTHENDMGSLGEGNHYYFVRCVDIAGNAMASSALINFTLIVNDTGEDEPIVQLEGPENNTQKNFNIVQFTYNVTSPTADIAYCSLKLDGLLSTGGDIDQIIIDNSVAENLSQSLITSLARGNYTWYVNCTDNTVLQNRGQSLIYGLRINASLDETYINSCDGWCGYYGFSEGACENSIPKCNNNCGLPYSANHNCYAGSNVSGTYCLGGPEADTCCCIV